MPNSRPRIVFNSDGVCNACINGEEKIQINWDDRKKKFLELIKKIKKLKNTNQMYDCVVPWSGGKDSSAIAYKLKFEFGLNPLLVTFSPLIINEVGAYNREILLEKGFDSIFVRPNQNVARKLAKRFFIERGNPKVAWDAGINSAPVRVALNYKIPTVFYAEHGESEYGGLVLDEKSKIKRDLSEIVEHLVGDYPQNWASKDISSKDLSAYIYPDEDDFKNFKVDPYYFSYFFKWSMLENYEFIKKNLPKFKKSQKRTDGTFTDFDSLDDKIDNLYYYMQFIKFGFGRATRDACRMIQNNQMNREEAIELARKYDNEFPQTNFEEVLNYLDINRNQFDEIVNKHRNHEIWEIKNNQWKLKYQI